MYKQGVHGVCWLNSTKYPMPKKTRQKKRDHSPANELEKKVSNGQLESLKECLKIGTKLLKITHMSLITCERAHIYLVQNKKAQRKFRQEQTLIQSDVSCIWENTPNKTLDSTVITKINAEKCFSVYVCVYIYTYMHVCVSVCIYVILLSKSNSIEITGLTFHSKVKGKSKHRLFDKHSKQCHGQKKGQVFFSENAPRGNKQLSVKVTINSKVQCH